MSSPVGLYTRKFLVEIKRRAFRRGVWFKALDQVERGILSLTAQIVDRVESVILGVELAKMVRKLRDALKGRFARRMEDFGLRKAREAASQAIKWGNEAAIWWVSDMRFVSYLTTVDLNTPSGFGV